MNLNVLSKPYLKYRSVSSIMEVDLTYFTLREISTISQGDINFTRDTFNQRYYCPRDVSNYTYTVTSAKMSNITYTVGDSPSVASIPNYSIVISGLCLDEVTPTFTLSFDVESADGTNFDKNIITVNSST